MAVGANTLKTRLSRQLAIIWPPPASDKSWAIALRLLTDRERQLLGLRFMEIEAEREAIGDCRVVDGDPAEREAALLRNA